LELELELELEEYFFLKAFKSFTSISSPKTSAISVR